MYRSSFFGKGNLDASIHVVVLGSVNRNPYKTRQPPQPTPYRPPMIDHSMSVRKHHTLSITTIRNHHMIYTPNS